MSTSPGSRNPPLLDHMHPIVYAALFGLLLWFILSVWQFAGDGYADYLLVIVSGFVFIAAALPGILWWLWSKNRRPDTAQGESETLRAWAAGEIDTWQDRVKGTNAAIEMLLPIAAIAFGMTAFGIVFHFTVHRAV